MFTYEWNTNTAYYKNVIDSIKLELENRKVPLIITPIHDGWQLRFSWCDGDIVCHGFSYGHSEGHVESFGFPWDDETEEGVSELTIYEAVEKISNFYKEKEGVA